LLDAIDQHDRVNRILRAEAVALNAEDLAVVIAIDFIAESSDFLVLWVDECELAGIASYSSLREFKEHAYLAFLIDELILIIHCCLSSLNFAYNLCGGG
jgi:hypothetical protein